MRRPTELIEKFKKCNDLSQVQLEFVKEWDYELNDSSPTQFKPQSSKSVWWRCNQGHTWEAIIQRRFLGDGCPYCSGKRVTNDNCLQYVNPKLAKEWHYQKNLLSPKDVTRGSTKKVWWLCSLGHEWEARIDHRSNGAGCPYCKGRKLTINK